MMALQVDAKINGVEYKGLYCSIVNSRIQKSYPADENGILIPKFTTWVYINLFANAGERQKGSSMIQNHVFSANGELPLAGQYDFLKTQVLDMYEIDFSTSVSV